MNFARLHALKVELFFTEIYGEFYPIFSKSFPFNFDLSMRMIEEKEIIERNNRFVTKSNRKNAKVELFVRRFMSRILSNFLKKFSLSTLLIIVQFISNLFDPTFRLFDANDL